MGDVAGSPVPPRSTKLLARISTSSMTILSWPPDNDDAHDQSAHTSSGALWHMVRSGTTLMTRANCGCSAAAGRELGSSAGRVPASLPHVVTCRLQVARLPS